MIIFSLLESYLLASKKFGEHIIFIFCELQVLFLVQKIRLPLLVEITLVPYEDVITYTGYINKITVDSGSDLYKIIDDARKKSKLIKRL